MSLTVESTRLSKVEEDLTKRNAEKSSDESYLGEPATAEIFDVRTEENIGEDTVVEFDVWLPTSKQGCISFSEYDFEKGRVEEFLDNLNCTVTDLDSLYCEDGGGGVIYQTIPVTFTENHGWVTFYGSKRKHLESTYSGDSSWYNIGPMSGHPKPNKKYSHLLNTPSYLGVIISLYTWSVFPFVYGFITLCILWYLNSANTGMSMPRRKTVSTS